MNSLPPLPPGFTLDAPRADRASQAMRPFDQKLDKPRANADGSFSTEITRTVQTPSGWANVPSLWWGERGPVDLGEYSDDELAEFALSYEQSSGRAFPRFQSIDQAESSAKTRSAQGGATRSRLASNDAIPPLPEGFVLDSEIAEQTQPEVAPRSTAQEIGRQGALTGRAVLEGLGDLAAIPANALAGLGNLLLELDRRIAGNPDRAVIGDQSRGVPAALNAAGVASPETDTERMVNTIGRRATGAAATVGTGTALQGAQGVTSAVGQTMASNPVIQAVGSATGPAAAEIAREAGAGKVGQTVADLAGSIAPALIASGAQATVRGGFRGGEEGRKKVQENVETFGRIGTVPSVGQATESRVARGAESLLSRTPGGAGPIIRKAESQADEISAGIEKRAASLVRKTSAEQAGRHIQRSISGEGGFVERFKSQQERLYDKLDNFFPPQRKIAVSQTRNTLRSLNEDIEGAEALSQWFKNARIKGIHEAFKKDTASPALGKGAPGDLLKSARSTQQLDDIAQRLKVGLSENPTADDIDIENLYFKLRGEISKAEPSAKDVIEDIGTLPYEAVKKLRTLVGREMADAGIVSDVPRSKWKALYAALSRDLGKAVESNPVAKATWVRANKYTNFGMKRIEVIESVIDKNGGPEAVFRAATSGTKEGGTTLRAVMQSVDAEGKKMISATVLRRLGIAKAGVQGELGDKFSTESFLTNWNLLSPEAKRTLFDRYGPTFRTDMDKVAKVTANLREGSQVFRNPSGTQQATAQVATVAGFVSAFITGQLETAAAIAGAVGGANLSSRLMSNPRFVRWLAQTTRIPLGAYPAAVNSLAKTANETGDMDIARVVAMLEQQEQYTKDKGDRKRQDQ